MAGPIDKYALYEQAVQSPKFHIDWIASVYKELRGKYARSLREDFCGTFQLSCEWIKRNRRNRALGVDLDPKPLAYGKKRHAAKLTSEQQKRLSILNENVLSLPDRKADIVIAFNFSYCVFKDRTTLVRYFRSCLRSLSDDGIFIVDLAGGPGMIQTMRERKRLKHPKMGKYTYVWDQQSFDPITHDAQYAIHFKMENGREVRNAFKYDWRLWSIPELRDAFKEAGFAETKVYWETEHQGEGTGEYVIAEHGDNAYAWISYVVGMAKTNN